MPPCRLLPLAGLLLLLSGVSLSAAPPPPSEQLVEQVRRAIDNGKKFLRDQQVITAKDHGHWEVDGFSKTRHGGWTALATLALLQAGEKPDSPVIRRALRYLREEVPPADTYVVALQLLVFVEAGDPLDKPRIQRNLDWLLRARVVREREFRGWGYLENSPSADNSNTQYALLGLWAARTAGLRIERSVWEAIRDFYVRTQQDNGSWGYSDYARTGSYTMTVAGLCGLLIAGLELNADQQELQANGVARRCGVYAEDAHLAKALAAVGERFSLEDATSTYYNLYGLERAGRLSGQRFFADHDWYREGCKYLIERQHEDGSWYERRRAWDRWPVVSTSFALLFLSKGRTPVLISKLVHGSLDHPTNDWNRKRSDLRNLTEYASRELFKRQPLAWQIFNAREVRPTTAEQVRQLTGELLQAPIAYFSGHNSPNFMAWEKDLLRHYIEQGGFLLAEACCGSPQFDAGFRRLMKELFPDNELVPLTAHHPIWQAHSAVPPGEFPLLGIDLGCKTVVVYSPQPISGWWEANQSESGRGQLAFRLGANLIAYATGLEMPKPRGFHIEVADNRPETTVPRGYLQGAQLRLGDRWRSAANGLRNLMLDLRKRARLDVALQAQELYPDDRDLLRFKFLYLHGREEFAIGNVDFLRANLEDGGLLLADACCGNKAFDASFRQFMKQLFPDRPLEPIPLDDELFSKELNGSAITTVRCRRANADGQPEKEYQTVPPALEGIKIGQRWVVIYSKYDLGCALEKHQTPDCLGHDHESALKLAGAAVLYALQK